MANFESGVKAYIIGRAVVEVGFPVDFNGREEVNCYKCKFFSRSTDRCRLTEEIVAYPKIYRGANCPLELEGQA